jgi:transmembrane sensor
VSELAREAAAAWHDRLHGDHASAQARRAFDEWLALSPDHRRAYAQVEQAWACLRAAADKPEILALRHEAGLRVARTTYHHMRSLRWTAAAAAVLIVSGAGILQMRSSGSRSLFAWMSSSDTNRTYATTVGEQLSVTLSDGSHVTLDSQSELRVAFSKRERDVKLTRGQALFEVAKDRIHPFVVAAGSRRYVAVGTAFNVQVSPDQVRITMVEGTVRVEPTPGMLTVPAGDASAAADTQSAVVGAGTVPQVPHPTVTVIRAGDELVTDGRQVDHLYSADVAQVTRWQRGSLVFDNATLGDAVAEFNRYSVTRIELADPRLAQLRLSGTFTISRPELFVESITSYFPISAAQGAGGTVVLTAR